MARASQVCMDWPTTFYGGKSVWCAMLTGVWCPGWRSWSVATTRSPASPTRAASRLSPAYQWPAAALIMYVACICCTQAQWLAQYADIVQWSSINALAHYAAPTDLRLSQCPLLEGMFLSPYVIGHLFKQHHETSSSDAAAGMPSALSARHRLIALLPRLTSLNQSSISAKEREEAERLYLKAEAARFHGDESGNFARDHPQFERLVTIHGPPDPPAAVAPPTLKSTLLPVTIVLASDPQRPPTRKKLPRMCPTRTQPPL